MFWKEKSLSLMMQSSSMGDKFLKTHKCNYVQAGSV